MKKTLVLTAMLAMVFSAAAYAKNAYDLYNEAYDLYLVDDYGSAVKLFAKAIKMKPDFVKPYNKAGLAYAAMRQVDHAILMFKKAEYIDPKFSEAYYNAGVAYEIKYREKNPNNDMAMESYKKVIDLNNDTYSFVRASQNLAKLYQGQKKYDDAITLLRNAIKQEADFPELYNSSGLVYMETAQYDYAVKFFKKAVEAQHVYPEASTNLGIAFIKQGRLAAAIKQFEETLAESPNFAGVHYNYANALIVNGFYEKAISHLIKAIGLDNDTLGLYDKSTQHHVYPGDRAALENEIVDGYYSLGRAYEHMNMFNDAEKAYKAALEKKKDYVLAKNAYDSLRKKREDFRSHITFKKKVVEGEEGGEGEEQAVDESEMTKEQLAAAKKAKAEAEDVEDLRLPEDKPTPAEGEEASE